ncbi:GumC family protein [Flavihumibacter fluvii]|uniref:GumC family protein n=1 Tax=Flavihumibacter fluvii TaxID=2838157 RepID=UPI001BDE4817|nr:polysaccharide biosynthesis tyrosine autokinase [Flavihumibacter fluvii]ULQ54443.1 polysaccharide biosynthesis tyrosine autokinase [Flavihumibacter fluvii]
MQDNTVKPFQEKEEDLFKQLLNKYYPFWPLYALLAIVFLGLAYTYGKMTIPVYEAYSSVIIKDESKGLSESEILQDLNLFRGKKIVENEIEILKSHSFIAEVVNNLGLYADVYEEAKFRTVPAYTVSPVKLIFKNPGQVIKIDKIPFSYDNLLQEVIIGENKFPVNKWVTTKWGEVSFLQNLKFTPDTITRKLFFRTKPSEVVEAEILKQLKVVPASKTATVINLSIKDNVPEKAVDILNELVKVYTEAEIKDKSLRAANAVAMVESRIRNVAGQLDSVENEIQKFRSDEGVIDISTQGRQYLENVGQNDRQIEELKNQLAILDVVEKFILSKDATSSVVPSSVGVTDPMLNQMLNKLSDYQLQYERLKRTTGENSSIIVGIRDQIEQLKPGILENIRNQKVNLNITKNSLEYSGTKYTSMLNTIPKKEKQLIEISRQQAIKNQLYGFLLEKREDAALSFTSNSKGDTRIIDKAFASVLPVSPNKMLLYLSAIVFGLAAGIIIVSLREALSKRILFRSEINRMSDFPVIAEIQHTSSRDPFVLAGSGNSAVAGQIKSLRNNLFFGANGNSGKKVIVTSASDGDGKTFITTNLAMSLAQTNARVLLMDIDFKNSNISKLYNLENEKGIADYLNRNVGLESILYPYKTIENLSVMPAGNCSNGNSGELLMSEQFRKLINELDTKFDHIILAGTSFSDDVNIQAVSHFADICLFVIRQGVTSKANLTMLINNRNILALKHPVFVFNDVKGRGWGMKMFGNGFGYGNNPKV